MERPVQTAVADTKPYNPVHARNIPLELAQIALERGEGQSKAQFKQLGYTDEQLSDENIARAAELYARLQQKQV